MANRESIARVSGHRLAPLVHVKTVCAHSLGLGGSLAAVAGPAAPAEAAPEQNPVPAQIAGESQPLVSFALDTLEGRPEARIEDAYKFLYQATRGGEHAAPDEASARAWLARDWASLPAAGAATEEPALEWLRHDGALVRVHLRPAKAQGVTEAAVLQAFLASARAVRMDASGFTYAWQALGERLRQRPQNHLTRAAWDALDVAMLPKGYPAVHHSPPYVAAYEPAYRVMRRADAEALVMTPP